MEQPRVPDQWDIKAARIHGADKGSDPTPEVVVTGVMLTFANVFALTLMFVVAQAVVGGIVLLALYLLGAI